MPRYLHLLRHAQSADKQTGQTDKDRTLTPAGLAEARAVGFFFKEKSVIPELIITSSAIRAKATSQVVAEVLAYDTEKMVVEEELYEATVTTFFQVLSEVDPYINSVLLVGHNPVITFFADHLTKQQNNFQPAEVLTLKIDSSGWKVLPKDCIEIAGRFHPII